MQYKVKWIEGNENECHLQSSNSVHNTTSIYLECRAQLLVIVNYVLQ